MKLTDMTYHESYGEVSVEQLRAYKRHNVSQSDHDTLVDVYGENRHHAITMAVKDERNHSGRSFSDYKFMQNVQDDY
jgi:hypothetical protein